MGRHPLPSQITEQETQAYSQHQVYDVGVGELHQVHETGVAQDTGIGFENARAHPAEDGIQERGVDQVVQMKHGNLQAEDNPIREDAAHEYDEGIGEQNSPVRQHFLAEIPGGKLSKYHTQKFLL